MFVPVPSAPLARISAVRCWMTKNNEIFNRHPWTSSGADTPAWSRDESAAATTAAALRLAESYIWSSLPATRSRASPSYAAPVRRFSGVVSWRCVFAADEDDLAALDDRKRRTPCRADSGQSSVNRSFHQSFLSHVDPRQRFSTVVK